MSTFECPNCRTIVDDGEIPDHLNDMQNNRFEYQCDCGCTFSVDVDWEPTFFILKETVTLPEPAGEAQGDGARTESCASGLLPQSEG